MVSQFITIITRESDVAINLWKIFEMDRNAYKMYKDSFWIVASY